MKKLAFKIVLIGIILSSIIYSQEGNISVTEMEICKKVENLQPIGVKASFSDTVNNIYCFTKIEGSPDSTSISHVWYYEGAEMARVNLDVNSPSWRTWSSKEILQDWTGNWTVEVLSADGQFLRSKEFTITSSKAE